MCPRTEWELCADSVGVLDVPGADEAVVVSVGVVPRKVGLLPLPSLTLEVGGVTVGGAQVYNVSHGLMVTVNN